MKKLVLITLCLFFAGISYVHPHSVKYVQGGGQGVTDCSNNGTYYRHTYSDGNDKTNGPKVEHFTPNMSGDPCFEFNGNCDSRYDGGHGHRTDDRQGTEWGYWTCEAYEHLCDDPCSVTPPPPPPRPRPPSNPRPHRPSTNQQNPQDDTQPQSIVSTDVTQTDTTSYIQPSGESQPTSVETYVGIEFSCPNPLPTCDPMLDTDDIVCHNWDIDRRFQWIGFPVVPEGESPTVGLLHSIFTSKLGRRISFEVYDNGEWLYYLNIGELETYPEVADIPVTPHLAISVNFRGAEYDCDIGIRGTRQRGEILNLEKGYYLIGLPEKPAKYEYASDLLSDSIRTVTFLDKRKIIIRYKDDFGDRLLKAGDAFRLNVTKPTELDLRGTIPDTPAAPSAFSRITMTWGAIKRSR